MVDRVKVTAKFTPGKRVKPEIPKPAFAPPKSVFNDKGEKGRIAKSTIGKK